MLETGQEIRKLKRKSVATTIMWILLCASLVAFARADAGTEQDAGSTPGTALFITPGTYNGTLSIIPEDTIDFYNFTAYNGHRIYVTMTPPPAADFQLELHNPSGNLKDGSYNGIGETEEVEYYADSDGNWSIRISQHIGEGNYTFTLEPVSYPPQIPGAPLGSNSGYVYTSYTYIASTTDIEDDSITYEFDWNDSTSHTIKGPYASGENATASHEWKYPKTYQVRVKAKDDHGFWSDWSEPTSITLSQNDANSGGDAGNNAANALSIDPGSYKGTLYYPDPIDTIDFYNFTAETGDWIHATMTPPTEADFQLELHDPNGEIRDSSYNGVGQPEAVDFQADLSGDWSLRISRSTGEGQCNFALTVSHNTAVLTINVPQAPPEGVTIWIDNQPHQAYADNPVIVTLALGNHTVKAQQSFIKEEWMPGYYYIYRFHHWSDGSTDNPRTVNLTSDTTLTAYYQRSKYPIL